MNKYYFQAIYIHTHTHTHTHTYIHIHTYIKERKSLKKNLLELGTTLLARSGEATSTGEGQKWSL